MDFLQITDFAPPNMSLDDGSEWQFTPLVPSGWQKGDKIAITQRDTANTRMKLKSLFIVKNITRKEESQAVCLRNPTKADQALNINKSFTEFKEYPNQGKKMTIQTTDEKEISLNDNSHWEPFGLANLPTAGPVEWYKGDTVIVSRGVQKRNSVMKVYQMKNLDQGNEVMAIWLDCEG